MNDRDMRRLLRSNPKLVRYCIQRILGDTETARIFRSIVSSPKEEKDVKTEKTIPSG